MKLKPKYQKNPTEGCSYETEIFANLLTQSASTKQTKYLIIKR